MSKILLLIFLLSIFKVILGNLIPEFYNDWIQKYQKISGNQTPPAKYKQWLQIAENLGCSLDPADYKQIFEDLKPYKKIKLTVKKIMEFERYIWISGSYVTGRDMKTLLRTSSDWPLQNSLNFLSQVLDPSINFYAITHAYDESFVAPADYDQDRPYADMDDLLRRCKAVHNFHKNYIDNVMAFKAPNSFIAVPIDFPIFSSNRMKGFKDIILPARTGLEAYVSNHQDALNSPVWEKKLNKAIFRGRTTGVNFQKVRKEHIPLTENARFKLHEMTMKQKAGKLECSVPLDFGLTEIWQCEEEENYIEEIKSQFPLVPSLDYKTQFEAKYQVIVDGNGWPDRIAFYLLSGSLIFLATVNEDWVINQLVDGEHYIKIKPDLSDLIEKLEWAAKNDEEAKRIATNGREFSMKKFKLESMQVYNAFLLMEYQRLFRNNKTEK